MERDPAPEPAKPNPMACAKLRLVSELVMMRSSDPGPRAELVSHPVPLYAQSPAPSSLFPQKLQVGIGSPAEMTSSRYAPVWGGDGNSWLSTSSWIRYPMTLCQLPSAS